MVEKSKKFDILEIIVIYNYMENNLGWKRLERLDIFDSKYLKVYRDKVCLPNGNECDFFLTKKSNIVVIVAITSDSKLIMIDEYKYAAEKHMTVLPAGHVEINEEIIEAAKRELAEETGYVGVDYAYLGRLYESPVQDLHHVDVVMVKNVKKIMQVSHEKSEDIRLHLTKISDLKKNILNNKIQSCSTLGALSLTGLLL